MEKKDSSRGGGLKAKSRLGDEQSSKPGEVESIWFLFFRTF